MLFSVNNYSLFVGDIVFSLSDFFFVFAIICCVCLGLYFERIVKSLFLSKLIIELSLPLILLNIVFLYYFFLAINIT